MKDFQHDIPEELVNDLTEIDQETVSGGYFSMYFDHQTIGTLANNTTTLQLTPSDGGVISNYQSNGSSAYFGERTQFGFVSSDATPIPVVLDMTKLLVQRLTGYLY